MPRLNYEVREYTPSYRTPKRLKNEWRSPSTGVLLREPADCAELGLRTLDRLERELVDEITTLKGQRGARSASMRRAGRTEKEIGQELGRLSSRHAFLAVLCNAVKAEVSKRRKKSPRHWSVLFVEVCRQRLEPDTFKRIEAESLEKLAALVEEAA